MKVHKGKHLCDTFPSSETSLRICELKRDEVTGGWRKLCSEELKFVHLTKYSEVFQALQHVVKQLSWSKLIHYRLLNLRS